MDQEDVTSRAGQGNIELPSLFNELAVADVIVAELTVPLAKRHQGILQPSEDHCGELPALARVVRGDGNATMHLDAPREVRETDVLVIGGLPKLINGLDFVGMNRSILENRAETKSLDERQ